jgi:hypothetical protein
MKPVWVTVAARPAVGSFAREVRAEMTALPASTAAAAPGTGQVRRHNEGPAYTGHWRSAADGPDGEFASSSRTRPATPAGTVACSPRRPPGTWMADQAVRLLCASRPAAAACHARQTQHGPRRQTALECTKFACHTRRRGGQSGGRTSMSGSPPYRRASSGNAALARSHLGSAPADQLRCPVP